MSKTPHRHLSLTNLEVKKPDLPLSFLCFKHTYGVKVPTVTTYFWIIKVLCTTVGETFADYFNTQLNFGLGNTTGLFCGLCALFMVIQFSLNQYFPAVYWMCVVLISVTGTLLTDNLTDGLGVDLAITTPWAALILASVFACWYYVEKTLSIHSIYTLRREIFYWLTVLFTFTLGTAAGDLIADRLAIGFGNSLCLFSGLIMFFGLLWAENLINPVAGFWIVYILTRPLGASCGDLLSQDPTDFYAGAFNLTGNAMNNDAPFAGPYTAQDHWFYGLALGTTNTSIIFLCLISVLVIYLAMTRRDLITSDDLKKEDLKHVEEGVQLTAPTTPIVVEGAPTTVAADEVTKENVLNRRRF